jgi:hypothetical protein
MEIKIVNPLKIFIINLILAVFIIISCNNPFATREPEKPTSGGVAIKPPNSPENVLDNLKNSFQGLSIQDYLSVYSENFRFHPDPDDSVLFEQDFSGGWDFDKETQFANFFLQRQNFRDGATQPIEIDPVYEYKPGLDYYEYQYLMFVSTKDSTETYEGVAWLYLNKDTDGKWSIYKWIDKRLTKNSMTWGALRAKNI